MYTRLIDMYPFRPISSRPSNRRNLVQTSDNFSCQVIRLDSELLVSLHGDLDMYSISEVQKQIWGWLEPEITKVTFDCDWVQYVDSAFLQFLSRIAGQVETVQIINASRTVRKSLEMTGLNRLLKLD
ncbi:MAG TPA: hypothetical protein DE036_01265 [Actinobacteria bacterium]|nr:hypothetical protein [Actinomycetota bacterium]